MQHIYVGVLYYIAIIVVELPQAAPSELIYQTSHKTSVLSSGDILQLERVSPQEIILKPPEKLVIETPHNYYYRHLGSV